MKAWILLAAFVLAAPGEAPKGPRPVAFVLRVEGTVRLGGPPPEAAEPWRRLAPGETLETSAGATVSVVYFRTGRIYLLEPGGRARVDRGELVARQGKVRLLKDLPAKVKLVPLLGPGATRRPAAGNVRGGEEGEIPLVPVGGAAICLPGVRGKVEILDERERVIHRAEAAPRIEIPAGVLQSGRSYTFRVAGKEGLFETLDRRQGRARAALEEEAARTGDPDLERLLDRVDEELGVRGCLGEEEERT